MWFQKKCPLQLELASQCGECKTSATNCSYFLGSTGMAAKTISKTFAKSWMKGMAWFERWETQPSLKFILCGISNMRSDRFCKGKKGKYLTFSFLHEISYLLTSLWHDLISPFNFDTATQKLGKDKKKCKKKSKSDFGSIFKPTLKKSPSERICLIFYVLYDILPDPAVGWDSPPFIPTGHFISNFLPRKKICFL